MIITGAKDTEILCETKKFLKIYTRLLDLGAKEVSSVLLTVACSMPKTIQNTLNILDWININNVNILTFLSLHLQDNSRIKYKNYCFQKFQKYHIFYRFQYILSHFIFLTVGPSWSSIWHVPVNCKLSMFEFKYLFWDFLGGPSVKTPHFHCRGHGFDPWLGNWDPTCWRVQPNK